MIKISMKSGFASFLFVAAFGLALNCCDDEDDSANGQEETSKPCTIADECYAGVDRNLIQGEVVCMDRVEGGYCTHHCETDEDCCSAEGECESSLAEVCGPFESTGEKFCFLSCDDLDEAEQENYCQTYAHPSFICRSTGGGSENRKVCVPEG